ncbi:MAG: bifunctional hydroxymethylpyrimidine kinase/phosphomethylpyrimidine kinase [Thaumarchaeota archaeon]|nr:bifunctional hydroxymethylpyrimidine kinase/phosphomethylpyrimidine kinase [Nitrososphaerota archaeon]
MVKRALTIAGSDSGGGAGIQADLKTFAAFGVHGMSAITAITAQNTRDVTKVMDASPEVIRAQIRVVADDIGVDAAKTGMLHTSTIIDAVSSEVRRYGFLLVVDPVMVSKGGSVLLLPEARDALIAKIIPLAAVVTPNIPEAEVLSGLKIKTLEDAEKAGKRILKMGAKAVVIKGGHMPVGNSSIDTLVTKTKTLRLEEKWVKGKNTHGTGCCFSAAITANLAKGKDVEESVRIAKKFVTRAIELGLQIGKGHGPVNPTGELYLDAQKVQVLSSIQRAVSIIEANSKFAGLIPESQSNIAMALPEAKGIEDVAAIPGRIVRIGNKARASSFPAFGASSHVAKMVLVAMKHDAEVRSAINIRYDESLIKNAKSKFVVSSYDRRKEPKEIKIQEGRSTAWGAEQAIRKIGRVPDIIYHEGDWGKEPMIVVLGRDAEEVARKAMPLIAKYGT